MLTPGSRFNTLLPILRARPLAPLAEGVVEGIALAHLKGAGIPLIALGAVAATLSIRWRHPALLIIQGLGLGALRLQAAERPPHDLPRAPLEGRVDGPPGVDVTVVERVGKPLHRGDIEFLGPPVWEKFGRAVPPNETSIVMRVAGVLFPGDIEERGVEELLTLQDLRAADHGARGSDRDPVEVDPRFQATGAPPRRRGGRRGNRICGCLLPDAYCLN